MTTASTYPGLISLIWAGSQLQLLDQRLLPERPSICR